MEFLRSKTLAGPGPFRRPPKNGHAGIIVLAFLFFGIGPSPASAGQAADKLITKARKTLSTDKNLSSYLVQVYSKTVLDQFDGDKKTFEIKYITLVHTNLYWKAPGSVKAVETARKTVADLKLVDAASDRLSFFDFAVDDVKIQASSIVNSVTIPSPFGSKRNEHYNFSFVDTTRVGDTPALQIRIQPLERYAPLFAGTVWISAHSHRVLMIDLGFNEAVKYTPGVDSVRFVQSYRDFQGFWLPDRIGWTGTIDIPFVLRRVRFNSVSVVYGSEINPDLTTTFTESAPAEEILDYETLGNRLLGREVFGHKTFERLDDADFKDSTFWNQNQVIPLTNREAVAFKTISVRTGQAIADLREIEKYKRRLEREDINPGFGPAFLVRYNRVEGLHLGSGANFEDIALKNILRGLSLRGKLGYGFSDQKIKYTLEAEKSLMLASRTYLGARFYKKLSFSEKESAVQVTPNSLTSIIWGDDLLNYFKTTGFDLFFRTEPGYHVLLTGGFTRRSDDSVRQHTDYSLIKFGDGLQANPPVNEGRLHRLDAGIRVESDNSVSNFRARYWLLDCQIEHSDASRLGSDFDFTRYLFNGRFRQPTGYRSYLDCEVSAGTSRGRLPQQYLYDFYGRTGLSSPVRVMKTFLLGDFEGSRFALFALEFHFGGALLGRTGIPFIKKHLEMVPSFNAGFIDATSRSRRILVDPDIETIPDPVFEVGLGFSDHWKFFRADVTHRLNRRNLVGSTWVFSISFFGPK